MCRWEGPAPTFEVPVVVCAAQACACQAGVVPGRQPAPVPGNHKLLKDAPCLLCWEIVKEELPLLLEPGRELSIACKVVILTDGVDLHSDKRGLGRGRMGMSDQGS